MERAAALSQTKDEGQMFDAKIPAGKAGKQLEVKRNKNLRICIEQETCIKTGAAAQQLLQPLNIRRADRKGDSCQQEYEKVLKQAFT